MHRILAKAGFENILFAESGEAGLTKIKSESPDLVIIDIMMPGMSGCQLGEILRRDEGLCSIPRIFVTGLLDKAESDNLGNKIGNDFIVSKASDTEKIIETIRSLLDR